ncbi:ermin [Rhinoderma darwinii]|uniref:ermin n=1 Tax=Rhinoderma darwinii TaxID=43563 RepID=UPI003F67557A
MAEEAQAPEYNGNEKPKIIPVQITDVIDQIGRSIACEESHCDSVFTSEGLDVLLEDKIMTPALDLNEKNEDGQKGENNTTVEKVPDMLDNHEKESGDNEGGCQTRVEIDGDIALLPSTDDISKQDKDQDGDKNETPDILLYEQSRHPNETGTEDILSETEEENTSIETDTEYGDGSYDEQDNGPQQSLAVSPSGSHLESNEMAGSRPDISRHSYSRYDTVSYRKIRKGNTKQRIDEFESMMNL